MIKHLWNLSVDKHRSLWLGERVTSKKKSILAIKIAADSSWTWRKLMGLRAIPWQNIKHMVGNEISTFL